MAHRRGRISRISDSQRRKKLWVSVGAAARDDVQAATFISPTLNFDSPLVAGQPSPAANQFSYVFGTALDVTGSIPPESTILRIRGSLNMPKNSIGANDIETQAFGIGIMESNAALTPGAIPNPANVLGADWDGWMFYRSINTAILDAEASIIDVKSMRKVQSGYSLVITAGAESITFDDSVVSTPIIAAQLTVRMLLLLP